MRDDDLTDDEWRRVQKDLREDLDAFYGVYEGEETGRQEVRDETDDYVIFADAHGQELNEIAEIHGVDRTALSVRMHKEARARYDGDGPGDAWSVADPIVVIKGGDTDE